MQINARCEADVTPAQIMKRLNEASGSKYSVHNETHQPERITPLQSAYKKTEIPDIAALQRNPTKPEPAPKVIAEEEDVNYTTHRQGMEPRHVVPLPFPFYFPGVSS